ncbi:MAG: carotenoid biosynthesis protein [Leptospirales bacterium]|nr:carotenoid biosynthesis protein [Leptospirales bacterium]
MSIARSSAANKWGQDLWRHLPLLCNLSWPLLLLDWLPASPDGLPWLHFGTLLFPLSAAAVYGAALRRLDRGLLPRFWIGALLFALATIVVLYRQKNPSAVSPPRLWTELLLLLWTVLLALHCRQRFGTLRLVQLFPVAGIYALLAENGGIQMGFFEEHGYNFYAPGTATPLAAVCGWLTVYYPAFWLQRSIMQAWPRLSGYALSGRAGNALRILIAAATMALLALLTDLHLDPVAVKLGYWSFHPALTPVFAGIPPVNFSSWFCSVFSFALAALLLDALAVRKPLLSLLVLLFAIPVVLGLAFALNFGLLAALEGIEGPSWRLLRAYLMALRL